MCLDETSWVGQALALFGGGYLPVYDGEYHVPCASASATSQLVTLASFVVTVLVMPSVVICVGAQGLYAWLIREVFQSLFDTCVR